MVEALASGLVTLTYDYAAGHQFIQSGQNGFLAPLGDEAALISTMQQILDDREQWKDIRFAARKTAENYPWSTTIERFSSLLSHAAQLEQNLPQIDIVNGVTEPSL